MFLWWPSLNFLRSGTLAFYNKLVTLQMLTAIILALYSMDVCDEENFVLSI